MMNIHFYGQKLQTGRKPMNFKQFCVDICEKVNLRNDENYVYEYKTSDNIYNILEESNYNEFMDSNVTDIYIYISKEETQVYKNSNNNKISKEENDEEDINFYQDENDDDENKNDINKIQQEILLKERAKQNIINEQKKKIRESRLRKEQEEKDKIKEQKAFIIQFQNEKNDNENYNDDSNNEIINIIEKNFEQFKENLIHESIEQSKIIVMESKLKLEDNNAIETPSSVEIHNGSVCNGCGEFPIIGIRYKCLDCKDFDYCEKCYEDKKNIHKHPFYKLRFMIE